MVFEYFPLNWKQYVLLWLWPILDVHAPTRELPNLQAVTALNPASLFCVESPATMKLRPLQADYISPVYSSLFSQLFIVLGCVLEAPLPGRLCSILCSSVNSLDHNIMRGQVPAATESSAPSRCLSSFSSVDPLVGNVPHLHGTSLNS